jgi:cytosine/adenosine deaminase-related metal-dependent hydrolase
MAARSGITTGRALFDAALAGGTVALGAIAGLRPGAPADLVALDATHASLVGRSGDGWLDGWIFATDHAVATVWRRGIAMVRDGRHVGRPAIDRAYRRTIKRLMAT